MQACWFYAGLFSHFDAVGILPDDPVYLSKIVFPVRRDVTTTKVRKWIDALLKHEKLIRLNWKNVSVLFCPEFVDTQHAFHNEDITFEIPLEILVSAAPKVATKLQQRCTLALGSRLLTSDSSLMSPAGAAAQAPGWTTPPKKWLPPRDEESPKPEEVAAIFDAQFGFKNKENLTTLSVSETGPAPNDDHLRKAIENAAQAIQKAVNNAGELQERNPTLVSGNSDGT